MSDNPYRHQPAFCFWRGSVAGVEAGEVDPVISAKFTIGRSDKIVTAGSCFAQHIARHLRESGFAYFVTETVHPLFPPEMAEPYNYGVFSARYGNLYTSRQLVQLLHRGYGLFQPQEDSWAGEGGRVIDPFRPQIQPGGFSSRAEFEVDRRQHFAAVRKAIENLDVFVFTLGLTEAWVSKIDGAAFPLCPGVAGGTYDEERHAFVNLTASEVAADLARAIDFIRAANPRARFILTVSPVPLIATAENRSVLVSTVYSKAVLRVAAAEIADHRDYVAYFPSFEVITGPHAGNGYFAPDLRSVTEAGVAHVMRLFMKYYCTGAAAEHPSPSVELDRDKYVAELEEAARVVCEEVLLDQR